MEPASSDELLIKLKPDVSSQIVKENNNPNANSMINKPETLEDSSHNVIPDEPQVNFKSIDEESKEDKQKEDDTLRPEKEVK